MKELTQTSLDPGNCWQTAVACILDVDAEELPSQVAIEAAGGSYNNALQAYLAKHHGKGYVAMHVPGEAYEQLRISGYHLMIGATARTPTSGVHHVVVGLDGAMVWDPHPSRAGLTDEISWALITSRPKAWKEPRDPCACPRCVP